MHRNQMTPHRTNGVGVFGSYSQFPTHTDNTVPRYAWVQQTECGRRCSDKLLIMCLVMFVEILHQEG